MCGRYYIDDDDYEIQQIIAALGDDGPINTGEIFPTNVVPVIAQGGKIRLMKWGFARYNGGGKVINARSETAAEKSMFSKAMGQCRCLLPASHYFEWQRSGSTKKQKYAISLPEKETLYMAGLFREEKDQPLPVFVILTRQAAPSVMDIHDRMPVILPKSVQPLWLNSDHAAPLMDLAATELQTFPVS